MRSARFTKSNFPREGDAKYRDLALIAQDIDEQERALTQLRADLTALAAIPDPVITVDGVTVFGDAVGDPLSADIVSGQDFWSMYVSAATSGDPLPGFILWNNATQASATEIKINHKTANGLDVFLFFGEFAAGDQISIQDPADFTNFQIWDVVSVDALVFGTGIVMTVALDSSGGTGTTNFAADQKLIVARVASCACVYEVTYSELVNLISLSLLSRFSYYLISDFESTFIIYPTATDGTGVAEPIYVLATSPNTLAPQAYSPLWSDDVIYYSVNDTTPLTPTNPAISKGVITYRKDTKKNLSAHYDWRNVLFRRWERTAGGGIFFWNIDPAPFVGVGGQATSDFFTFYTADGAGNRSCSFGPNTYNVVLEDSNSGIEIGPDCGIGGGINIGGFNNGIKIGSNCATVGSAGSLQPPGIYIGSSNLYIEIGKRSYAVWIGNSCYAVTLGNQNSDVVIVNDTWRRTVNKGFSNVETTLDITGLTNIDFGQVTLLGGLISDSGRFCGLVRLTSTNATETIDTILAGNSTVFSPYRFIPENGLEVTFNDSSVSGGNILLSGVNLVVDGTLDQYAIFDRYMTNLGNTEPDYHLEYTNVPIVPGGDVFGPAISVDENIVIFDGITGKLIKDSGVSTAGIKVFNYLNFM